MTDSRRNSGRQPAQLHQIRLTGRCGQCRRAPAVRRAKCAGAEATDYKALVCVFLYGGNDANNTLIPFDTRDMRTTRACAGHWRLPQNTLLQLRACAELCAQSEPSGYADAVQQQGAAIVTNVGTLMEPTTRAQYLAGQRCRRICFRTRTSNWSGRMRRRVERPEPAGPAGSPMR